MSQLYPASHNYLCAVLEEIWGILTLAYVWFTVIWKWSSKCLDMHQKNATLNTVRASYLTSDCIFHKALVEMMWCMPNLLHLSASLHSYISSWIPVWWLINDAFEKQQNFSASLDDLRCCSEISYIIFKSLLTPPLPLHSPPFLPPVRSWASRSGWGWRAREVRPWRTDRRRL